MFVLFCIFFSNGGSLYNTARGVEVYALILEQELPFFNSEVTVLPLLEKENNQFFSSMETRIQTTISSFVNFKLK
jgi:hypothetical protein